MTQKHVDLLLKAIAIPESCSEFLCDRIGFVSGRWDDYPKYVDPDYYYKLYNFGEDLCNLIKENINYKFSFNDSPYSLRMPREEWVETILVPLALALPEEN